MESWQVSNLFRQLVVQVLVALSAQNRKHIWPVSLFGFKYQPYWNCVGPETTFQLRVEGIVLLYNYNIICTCMYMLSLCKHVH